MDALTVQPGSPAGLAGRTTSGNRLEGFEPSEGARPKQGFANDLEEVKADLAKAQEVLWAADRWAVLVILQGLDASGKDGTIKHVMSGVNPQGCQVVSFKQPSTEDLQHDFLWRAVRALPGRGSIGVFNRSYYEEVLVVRVHPQLLAAQRLPPDAATGRALWDERYEDINAFERHLVRNGTTVVKCFLHLSRDEQRRRFLSRLDEPTKRWKYSAADLREREFFDEYQKAYESMLTATSTPWAPWFVVPADHKPALRVLVSGLIVDAVDRLDLAYPVVDDAQAADLDEARQRLEAEGD